jgi:inhibitor of KinA
MLYESPSYRIMGDGSALVELGDEISPEVNQRVRELFISLRIHPIKGVVATVPSYRSLLLIFDPLRLTLPLLQERVQDLLGTMDPSQLPEPRIVEIPVVYGGQLGPDLEWVAEYHNITPEEVIRLHTGSTYRVYMIGFMPGFPYMGELPEALYTPRRPTPRTSVPQGSVALALNQTGVYPSRSPGGWQIVGWTPFRLFDARNWPPAALEMGDQVKFFAIKEEEMGRWRK